MRISWSIFTNPKSEARLEFIRGSHKLNIQAEGQDEVACFYNSMECSLGFHGDYSLLFGSSIWIHTFSIWARQHLQC
jgi:hypothetical protein